MPLAARHLAGTVCGDGLFDLLAHFVALDHLLLNDLLGGLRRSLQGGALGGGASGRRSGGQSTKSNTRNQKSAERDIHKFHNPSPFRG